MKIAVFGYGSLVNSDSLQKTLGRKSNVIPTHLEGWVRDWSAVLENNEDSSHYVLSADEVVPENVTVLNIRPSNNLTSEVNGVLIECSSEELNSLVAREIHYSMVEVTNSIKENFDFDTIYSFTAKPEFTSAKNGEAIVPSSYANLVEEGFLELGEQHLKDFVKNTNKPTSGLAEAVFVPKP